MQIPARQEQQHKTIRKSPMAPQGQVVGAVNRKRTSRKRSSNHQGTTICSLNPKKLWSNRESDSFMRWKSSLFRLQTRRLPGECSDFLLEGDCCHNSKLDVKLPDENDRSIQDVSNEKPAHIGRYQKSKILFRFLFATP